jgi:hypothetical protein
MNAPKRLIELDEQTAIALEARAAGGDCPFVSLLPK